MFQNSKKIWFFIFLSFFTLQINAKNAPEIDGNKASDKTIKEENHGQEHKELTQKEEIKEEINHHVLDSHYFDISYDEETDTYYGFPLPVILIDNGLKVFMASEFDHGEEIVHKGDQYYRLYHDKIYKTDEKGTLIYNEEHKVTNEKPLDFSITKVVFSMIVACILLILILRSIAKSYANHALPKGIGRFLEPIIIYVRDEIAIPTIGKKHYRKYMGFLLTIFFFIWLLNLLGLLPFGINVTGNVAVTFTLALFTFLITNFSGKKVYWSHVFDPLGDSMPWIAKIPIYIILVPIEIFSIFVRPFSLLMRLFANMFAGHIVMMSIIGLIFLTRNFFGGSMSFLLAVAISLIEFFVALLQAYIFTMLSALYFGLAVEEEH